MMVDLAKVKLYAAKGGDKMAKITLSAARVNKKLSQAKAAELIGTSVATLKNWEWGKTYPRQPQIEKICEVYGVTYNDIFFG